MTTLTQNFQRPSFIDKPNSTSPFIGDARGLASVALSVLILSYSGLLSVVPILCFYALWLPLIYYKGRFTPALSRDIWLHVVYGAYCLLSTLWSYHPLISARSSLELASMLLCTIIMARLVRPEIYIKGIIIGTILVLIPALLSEDVFFMFGSKNQVGFVAEIGFISSFLYLFSNDGRMLRLPFGVFSLLVSAAGLIASHSAGSDASCATVIGISGIIYFLSKLPRRIRGPAFFISIFIFIPLIYAGFLAGAQSMLLEGLGKDSTLTGRTYLWSEGFKIALQNPILGRGMSAFWVIGEPQAERYWYEFYIFTRTGFHFHSLFVESFVDLGIIGVLLVTSFLVLNCLKSLRYVINRGANLYGAYSLCIAIMFLLRAFVEVDVLGAFGIGPFLFFSILPMLQTRLRESEADGNTVKKAQPLWANK